MPLWIELREGALAERLIAVLVQVGRLNDAARIGSPGSSAPLGGIAGVDQMAVHIYRRIGEINAQWLAEKAEDRHAALERARKATAALCRDPAIVRFLDIALDLETESLRQPCVLIAALLKIGLLEKYNLGGPVEPR